MFKPGAGDEIVLAVVEVRIPFGLEIATRHALTSAFDGGNSSSPLSLIVFQI